MRYLMPNGRYAELDELNINQLVDLYRQLRPIHSFDIHAPEHVLLHMARKIFLYHLRPYQVDIVLFRCV
jgi:hypothetical protein